MEIIIRKRNAVTTAKADHGLHAVHHPRQLALPAVAHLIRAALMVLLRCHGRMNVNVVQIPKAHRQTPSRSSGIFWVRFLPRTDSLENHPSAKISSILRKPCSRRFSYGNPCCMSL